MTKVVVKNNDVESALKKFKTKVARSGVPSELKKRKFYKKPGVVKREQEVAEELEAEKAEQTELRNEYRRAVTGNLAAQLENTYIMTPDGKKRKVGKGR